MGSNGRGWRERTVLRLHGLFVRWGLLDHPHGREYAREHYTLTGKRREEEDG